MSKKTPITIIKTFDIKITGGYQSYGFGSSMTLTLPKEIDPLQKEDQDYISRCNAWLSGKTIDTTLEDVKAFAGDNEKFRIILAKRNTEIEMLPKNFSELNISNTSNMDV